MTTNKMTYVEALDAAIVALTMDENTDNTAVVEKLTALRDQTAKRNSAERKPTKVQVANVGLSEKILEVLRNSATPLTVSEIMARDPELSTLSNQKVSALLRGLTAQVVKTTDKRVSRFSLAQ